MILRISGVLAVLAIFVLPSPGSARDRTELFAPRAGERIWPGVREVVLDDLESLRALGPGSEATFHLAGGLAVGGTVDGVVRRSAASATVHGYLDAGSFLLTIHEGVVVGTIALVDERWEIRPRANGRHEIRRVDDTDHAPCVAQPEPAIEERGPSAPSELQDDGSVIDVLVVYTPGAESAAGGTAGIEALIHASMDQTNMDFFNSAVSPRMRLVHVAETVYTESGDLGIDLDRLRAPFGGFMDEVHALRDTHGADQVALIVSSGDACGIAYLMTTLSAGFASSAFSVTVASCALNHTFAHELGHNLGCCHAVGDGGGCTTGGLHSYSVGWRFDGLSGTEWRTVMAYAPGSRIPYFSNPDVLWDGVPTGVPVGQMDEADNAMSIDTAALTASNWRQTVCNDTLPTLTLDTPNGGESLCPGFDAAVNWTTSDEFFYNYVVEYSDDGGSNWLVQGEGSSTGTAGTFTWSVPGLPSGQGLLRVTASNCAGSVSDTTDLVFTVVNDPPVTTVSSPNGGESFCAGTLQNIDWTNAATICEASSYQIEYSTDSGGAWTEITSGTGGGGGTYAWSVPVVTTTQGRVRVTLSTPAVSDADVSDADFEIASLGAPDVTVLAPNGGEIWGVGSVENITWDNSNCDATAHTIDYSTDGGANWLFVTSNPGPGTGSFPWTVPFAPSEQALVRVFLDNVGGADTDTSDAVFTIVQAPGVGGVTPDGGEIWVEGTTHAITWIPSGGAAATHTVEYSTDGGSGWIPIVTGQPGDGGGELLWAVPIGTTANARVRVTLDNVAGSGSTESGSSFSIVAPVGFVDATFGPLASTGANRGVAWGDHDGDGDDDLYVTSSIQANLFLENNGFGDFTDESSSALQNLGGEDYAARWIDHDDDGDLDLYVPSTGAANRLFRNDDGAFVDVATAPIDDAGAGRCGAWADYDGDGDVDVYLVQANEANKLLRNDGGDAFVDVTAGPLGDASFGNDASWVDYDGDGDPDLHVVNFGASFLLRNDAGSFVDVTSGAEGGPGASNGGTWGDYDDDGDADLYFVNLGANVLLRNDGGGSFVDVTAAPLGDADTGGGAAWADTDNDGDLDLYLANQGTANRLFRNDGSGFVDATPAGLDDAGNGNGVGWADANGDGTLDLFLSNLNTSNHMFLNYTTGANRWLHARLVGTVSNAAAIGARVRLVTASGTQHRRVRAGTGFVSQSSGKVAFGLGSEATADTVEVSWPSGIVQVVVGVAADQVITITEMDPTGAPELTSSGAAFRLSAAAPNPFRTSTSIAFEIPRAGHVRVAIFDVTGRLVRVLADRRVARGGHHVTWDGRDRAGRRVGSGLYFYRMDADDWRETRRLVHLK